MEKNKFEISIINLLVLLVVSILLIGYLYIMDSFLRINYWWILLVFFYIMYFIFEDMNLKKDESKENLKFKKNPTFFWKKLPLLFLFVLSCLLI